MSNEQKSEEDNEELNMVKYKKVQVSFYVKTKRGKKKKITFAARKPIKKGR